jgi:uncharacterized protein DUF6655
MRRSFIHLAISILCVAAVGCGTTKWSDTPRTATEQLLISTAVDRAIDNMNFKPLAGKDVYFDATYLEGIVDKNYVVSSLRQHMLAQGVTLVPDKESATYIVEARAGAVGTNHHDVLLGIPALSVPGASMIPGAPTAIPEIPFAKTTDQKGIAKIAAFAYNQDTGQPIWQSGVFPVVSNAKDTWILGTGPFQRGSIYDGTRFAGSRLLFSRKKKEDPAPKPEIPITAEAVFEERPMLARRFPRKSATNQPSKPAAAPGAPPPGSAATSGTTQGIGGAPAKPATPAPNATNGIAGGLPDGNVMRLPELNLPGRNAATTKK